MAKVVFNSRMKRPNAIFSPSSSGVAPIYEERIDFNGVTYLKKTGIHNINDFVQASLDNTLVYNILDRYQKGDVSVLEKVHGFYADVSNVPTSLLEAHNLMKKLTKDFDLLSPELKDKFGNSAEKFIAAIENGEFNKILSDMKDAPSKEIPSEKIDEKKVGDE